MAAVSPLGNVVLVNQNTPLATNMQNAVHNRLDMQAMVAQELQNEKNREIEEVRPAEESYRIDPENEHEKKHSQEEQNEEEEQKKEASRNSKKEEVAPSLRLHLLDIKV